MATDLDLMDANDKGGVGAKAGFLYQDYVAALYVTRMLLDKRLKGVRCEVTDDIDLIFDDHIEYVQVKSTDGDEKWSLTEFTERSKSKAVKGKRTVKADDSILHKSLECDSRQLIARFRMVTKRDVRKNLLYLRIPREKRANKEGSQALIKSLTNKIGQFRSPNGNSVAYWVDNAYWEVIPSVTQLKLEAQNNIMNSAAANGIYLDSNHAPQRILDGILCNLTGKSAKSRKIHTAKDKTYQREDFITWFECEVEALEDSKCRKIYTRDRTKLKPLLVELVDLSHIYPDDKDGFGLGQGYRRRRYRYDHIASAAKDWLPEFLLRPEELADSSGAGFIKNFEKLAKQLQEHSGEFEVFVGKLLLHSVIRCQERSQPIPATLYIDTGKTFKQFENIHIVKKDHDGDELWLGFSKFTNAKNIDEPIVEVCEELDELLADDFELQKEKILDVKQDNYLIKHDINEMLSAAASLDSYLDRFRFVIFIGYESTCLKDTECTNYKERLIKEVEKNFKLLIKKLVEKDEFFDDLKLSIYLYPVPSVKILMEAIKNKLTEVPNV